MSTHTGKRLQAANTTAVLVRTKLYPEEFAATRPGALVQVMEGLLVAPEVPEPAERPHMAALVGTYGKTIHTWQVDRGDALPLGMPLRLPTRRLLRLSCGSKSITNACPSWQACAPRLTTSGGSLATLRP